MFVITKMNMVSMPWVTCGQEKGFVLLDSLRPINNLRDGSSWVEPLLS